MGFRLRNKNGSHYTSATYIRPDGTAVAYDDGALAMTPIETANVQTRDHEKRVPVSWRVQLPAKHIDVVITAQNPQSWMATSIPYWEGPVIVRSPTGKRFGEGYLEMTGY